VVPEVAETSQEKVLECYRSRINPDSKLLIESFAPRPGAVHKRRETPSLIWRREIEICYFQEKLGFQYSRLIDPVWARRHMFSLATGNRHFI
jgi:hypothetical protein